MSDWDERLVAQRAAVRLVYDENLPPSLTKSLSDIFPASLHVRDLGLATAPDSSVWEYAKAFGYAIMTKDSDFATRVRIEGPPPTVIRIRAGNCSAQRLVTIIRENAPQIIVTVQFGGPLLEIGAERIAVVTEIPDPK